MPSVFLSHTCVDKPFVEKLARDLRRIGVNVWFDKWEIKVGESITWKIEEGIHQNEYLGIILSPEALNSEWVKSELSSAWVKQMQSKKVVVLPILFRDCSIPLFLSDRKYADFRRDYQAGLEELATVLGIKKTETISENNWRRFVNRTNSDWQKFRESEFIKLVTVLVDRGIEYNWSAWVGGKKNPYSITLYAFVNKDNMPSGIHSVSIKLAGRTFAYMASFKDEHNPNRLKTSDFATYVGNTINECEEFVWRRMEDFRNSFGIPYGKASYAVARFLDFNKKFELASQVARQFSWYEGNKLNNGGIYETN